MPFCFYSISSPCHASLPNPSPLRPPPHHHHHHHHHQPPPRLEAVKTLVESTTRTTPSSSVTAGHPIQSLRRGDWIKLICGASFEDAADVRNLSLVYTLAGVDCVDCAADASVVNAVVEGIEAARSIAPVRRPWVMISINDDKDDLHFRKAEFDPEDCPPDCSRPCEMVCPANAISLERVPVEDGFLHGLSSQDKLQGGVITERCYGCGRCFPVCPYDKIRAMTYVRDATITSELLKRSDVDAVEIHTSGRSPDFFKELWISLGNSIQHVKLVAISLPDAGESVVSAMDMLYSIMEADLQCDNLWQLDGRPMSGDIGRGATKEAIGFAVRLAAVQDRPHGFLQLAGGTNSHTVDCLKKVGLFKTMPIPKQTVGETCLSGSPGPQPALIGGVAYGGYARKIVGRVLNKMPTQHGHARIEDYPDYLLEALREALCLVGPVKCCDLASHLT